MHGARQRVAQSGDASDQCLLHRASQFRGRRDSQVASVQRFSQTKNHHPARRRRDSFSMEPPARHARERRIGALRRSGAPGVLGHGDLRQRVDGAVDQARRRRQSACSPPKCSARSTPSIPKTGRNFEDLVPIFQSIDGSATKSATTSPKAMRAKCFRGCLHRRKLSPWRITLGRRIGAGAIRNSETQIQLDEQDRLARRIMTACPGALTSP